MRVKVGDGPDEVVFEISDGAFGSEVERNAIETVIRACFGTLSGVIETALSQEASGPAVFMLLTDIERYIDLCPIFLSATTESLARISSKLAKVSSEDKLPDPSTMPLND